MDIEGVPKSHVSHFPVFHIFIRLLHRDYFIVQNDLSSPSTLHEAATDCVCSALYAAEDVARHSDLIILLFHGTHSLRSAYHYAAAQEDTDKYVAWFMLCLILIVVHFFLNMCAFIYAMYVGITNCTCVHC